MNALISIQQKNIFNDNLAENSIRNDGKVCPMILASHCLGGKTIAIAWLQRFDHERSLRQSLGDGINALADVGAQGDIDDTQWSILQLMLLGLDVRVPSQSQCPPLFPWILSPFTIKMRILLSK